jgi:hypothetical protein
MNQLIVVPPRPKQHIVNDMPAARRSARSTYARMVDPKELRQINEFSPAYENQRRKGIAYAFALIFFSLACLVLCISGLDVTAIFSAGALIMVINLVQCAREFFKEEQRARNAYYEYLDNFPLRVIRHLRDTPGMSDWTKFEIGNYLGRKSKSANSV